MAKSITVGTVCFLIDQKEKKILFLERNSEPMQNMFTGVGGKTNFDEDINKSCVREIKEETGLDAKNLKLKGVIKTLLTQVSHLPKYLNLQSLCLGLTVNSDIHFGGID